MDPIKCRLPMISTISLIWILSIFCVLSQSDISFSVLLWTHVFYRTEQNITISQNMFRVLSSQLLKRAYCIKDRPKTEESHVSKKKVEFQSEMSHKNFELYVKRIWFLLILCIWSHYMLERQLGDSITFQTVQLRSGILKADLVNLFELKLKNVLLALSNYFNCILDEQELYKLVIYNVQQNDALIWKLLVKPKSKILKKK